jgi:putative membrane protein
MRPNFQARKPERPPPSGFMSAQQDRGRSVPTHANLFDRLIIIAPPRSRYWANFAKRFTLRRRQPPKPLAANGNHREHCQLIWWLPEKERIPPMKCLASAFALLLLATPAMAQSVGEKTGVNSALGISPSTADFIKEAAVSDMFEIQSSRIAQERGNATEKTFAATMIKDHQKTSEELKSMVSNGDLKAELPTALDSSHQGKIDKLKSLKGADFSSRYDSDQVSGHKDAVSLFERYSKNGDNPKLKDWAGKTLPALRHHLEMAQNLSAGKTVGSH